MTAVYPNNWLCLWIHSTLAVKSINIVSRIISESFDSKEAYSLAVTINMLTISLLNLSKKKKEKDRKKGFWSV